MSRRLFKSGGGLVDDQARRTDLHGRFNGRPFAGAAGAPEAPPLRQRPADSQGKRRRIRASWTMPESTRSTIATYGHGVNGSVATSLDVATSSSR
jgi:hypothetical protein